ncbi:MAG: hypothetical protein RLZZ326_3356 [Planctomycetota bacterium]
MFTLRWTDEAAEVYGRLKSKAEAAPDRPAKGHRKAGREAGLFKQVHKCLTLLADNPRHPGLKTHEFRSLENPFDPKGKVFEAYAQNRTPGALRGFWCYGPSAGEITIIAITPHP